MEFMSKNVVISGVQITQHIHGAKVVDSCIFVFLASVNLLDRVSMNQHEFLFRN